MALSAYFDTSVLVALLVRDDAFNTRAETFVRNRHPLPVVIARRPDIELATFDIKMAASARALGVNLADI